jgi:glutamate/tyrosine decarboxylase-like PLP-dependent enzyme
MMSIQESLDTTLQQAAARASTYLEAARSRRVAPEGEAVNRLTELGGPFPPRPASPDAILELLDSIGAPATVASAGGRYFGYVIGGTLPAALAASWLASAWDQNAGMYAASPVGASLDRIALGWVAEALGLPVSAGGGIVTGATMANFSALTAARHALLERAGWDAERYGLFGAPPVHVLVGEEVHVSVLKSLALAGFGRERLRRVPVDGQGRIRPDALPPLDSNTLICIQAGNVNTGAFDPAVEICARARQANAWVHVDGAFGLWAAASPRYRHLTEGFERADSWATDAHKWPNVGYDCGIVMVREARHLRAAMSVSAAYLANAGNAEPNHFTPEMSRRARGIELWAALRSLGRDGLADLVDRTCAHARRFAEGLRQAGYEILNDVCINQVLVSFGTPQRTQAVIRKIQEDGVCWCGGTEWQGKTAMRISVSSWATTADDVERSLAAILRAAS